VSCNITRPSFIANGGRLFQQTFEFGDRNRDVVGGQLQSGGFFPNGVRGSFTETIPGPGVTITGTRAGTITDTICLRFGTNQVFTSVVSITDAAGNRSNEISVVVGRPAGFPEARRSSDAVAEGAGSH
jgi:hypothetical protein